jgi:hypothetical protein
VRLSKQERGESLKNYSVKFNPTQSDSLRHRTLPHRRFRHVEQVEGVRTANLQTGAVPSKLPNACVRQSFWGGVQGATMAGLASHSVADGSAPVTEPVTHESDRSTG